MSDGVGHDVEMRRLGLLLLAVAELSDGGYVLLRRGYSKRELRHEWRVNVRRNGLEYTSVTGTSMLRVLDLALERLQRARDGKIEPAGTWRRGRSLFAPPEEGSR